MALWPAILALVGVAQTALAVHRVRHGADALPHRRHS